MKKHLCFRNRAAMSTRFVALLMLVMLCSSGLNAQVNFTQTLNADFNKGYLNNVIVTGDNVSLQYAANEVGTWLTTTVLPQTLSGHAAASWTDRYAYVVGGWNNATYVNTVYMSTIQSGGISGWSSQNALPVALKDAAVVVGTNTIYVLGGRDDTQVFNSIYYAAINTNGTLGAWQTSAVTLPVALWGHTATYCNGYLYVAGGSSSMTENSALNTVYYAQVRANNTLSAFSAGSNLPGARNKHAAVTYRNKLYVLGGYDNAGTRFSSVYIATPSVSGTTGSWVSGSSMPFSISNHSAAVSNGTIVVMAGAVNSSPFLSNSVYYANADNATPTTLAWSTSANVMYDYTKDGAAFTGNGQVYYTGGTNLSGTPILNSRFANMSLTANYISNGVFVSNPFYELGAERMISTLSFTKVVGAGANFQIIYRTAGNDGIWGNWSAPATTSPITVNLTKRYLQYAVLLTGSGANNSALSDATITTPGTQLNGNLNAIATFTKAASPYWATSDISFTAGTHTFQAGATILFLPETGLTVGQANVICNGTAVDSVKFTYFTSESGNWDGIYFDENSDNGVSSQFYYTVISNAGFGGNNANLYCLNTNEPLLQRCNIRGADGNGIRLNNAHLNIQNTTVKSNTENGLYLQNSNPTLVSSLLTGNTGAGVYLTSTASVPNYSAGSTTISNNTYAIRYPSPNFDILQPNGSPTLTGNTYNGIALDGGSVTTNRRWYSITYDYILLGNLTVAEYAAAPRLTIEPGNTLRFLPGTQMKVGADYPYGGEIYAIGTSDSLITFTPFNGLPGGWNGIYFTEYSDNYGGLTQMIYCVIEKGNDYNYYSHMTVQPSLIQNCIIQNAALDGARYSSSTGTISNCQFLNNGRYPLYFMNPASNPVHTGNTFTGNTINRIALEGGTYNVSRTLTLDGTQYYVLNNILVQEYAANPRLTIEAGVVVDFAPGTKLQVGGGYPYAGELHCLGTSPTSQVILKAYSGLPGGWEGVHFTQYNDNYGGSSILQYTRIRHGNAQNILIEGSAQPTIDNGNIRESNGHGIVLYQSNPVITNTLFGLNNGYPIKFNDWTCDPYIKGNTYNASNTMNYIALSGGTYNTGRTLRHDGIPYHVLGNINMAEYAAHPRLTLLPGVTLLFDPGLTLQVGAGYPYSGDLFAEGKADSLISFKPFNNLAGGWGGLVFTMYSDDWGGNSSMEYCYVEKAATQNLWMQNTTQPVIDHCTFTQSTGNGIRLTDAANLNITSSSVIHNAANGFYFDNTSTGTIGNTDLTTCNMYNNGGYEVYNNSTSDIQARYNYWGTGDSTMVSFRIFDKSENTSKGRVHFGPFAQVPNASTANTTMSGTVKYANTGANPIKNAAMAVKTFANVTVASTTSNTSGVYAFPAFPSGNYQMTITPAAAWGGVNSTDALAILNHFAMIAPLTGIKMAAADVNYSHSINGTDAMLVMKRYSGQISSFPVGDYLHSTTALTVTGGNVTNNLEMICFGDVNASYGPAKKSTGSVGLVHEGSVLTESWSEFDLPVRMKTPMEVGAISLGFYYPEEFLEITGARLYDGTTGFSWTAANGLFRMGWCDMNALNVTYDQVVVILRIKTKDLSAMNTAILLNLYEESEFADAGAIPDPGAVVSIPAINTTLTGIGNELSKFSLSVSPNPVKEQAVVRFTMEKAGKVEIFLTDMLGNRLFTISDGEFLAGEQNVALKTSSLKPGLYFLRLNFVASGQSTSEMIKVVVSR